MDIERANRVFHKMAAEQGVRVQKIISSIDFTIAQAITKAQRENNAEILAYWRKIPCAGLIPTAAELLAFWGEQDAL